VAYNLTGNALNNTLTGNAADNTLDGGDGNDTLSGVSGNDSLVGGLGNDSLSGGVGNDELAGGGGNDTYVFDATLISSNHDTVQDFLTADDIFHLDNDIFTALNLGTLSSDAFHIGTAATDADTRILYNSTTGALSYDSDGTGSQTAVQFATITTANLVGTLTATNFVIVD
jgi:serralysin